MIDVNDRNFQEEVIDFDDLTFVDFWASWCGPCKMMSPKYNKASEDFNKWLTNTGIQTTQTRPT